MTDQPGYVWITHPELTPGHDQKILRSQLGVKVRQGWRERADQSDPPATVEPADPRQPADDSTDGSAAGSAAGESGAAAQSDPAAAGGAAADTTPDRQESPTPRRTSKEP